MRRPLARIANLFRRTQAEREMTREIESHLALMQEDFERSGMSPREAMLAARRVYGGVEQAKELHRDARTYVWIEQLLNDIAYAARNLRRTPGFTLVAVIALALGLGVNATAFAIFDALVMNPLPVSDPDRVVRLNRRDRQQTEGSRFPDAEYRYLRDRASAFSGLVASWGDLDSETGGLTALASVEGSAVTERLWGRAVSANYFAVLTETAPLGRFFSPQEDSAAGASPVVVLTWRFWQRRWGGDRSIIGRTIKLNGLPYTVIGIAPEKFTGTDLLPAEFDFWVPHSMLGRLNPTFKGDPLLLARLKRGVSRAQAQSEATFLLRQYLSASHERERDARVTLSRTRYLDLAGQSDGDSAGIEAATAAMWIVVSLVLGAACANVANMLLARGASRQREIGIRLAMGASRARVIRQLLLESVLLSVLGGSAAIPFSVLAGRWLWLSLAGIPQMLNLNLWQPDIGPDGHLLVYGLILSVVTGVLFGLAPALQFTRLDLNRTMKEEGSFFGARFRRSRLRGALLGSQAALSMLLLLVSGALLTRFHDTRASDLGFDIHNTYQVDAEDNEKLRADLWTLRDRIATLPEIAGDAIGVAPSGNDDAELVIKAGRWDGRAYVSTVSDGYFETMRMRIERGRGFTRQEADAHAALVVVTESTARRCWPGQDPLGKMLSLTLAGKHAGQRADLEVVGVVNDVRQADMIRVDPLRIYLPAGQPANPGNDLLFRVRSEPAKALAAVRSAVEAVDPKLLPGLNLFNLENGNIAAIRAVYRVMAMVAGILALLAVTLAVVGIYGVMAFLVTQRTREIGIRMALGATAVRLLKSTVVQGFRPVLIGMALGFAGAVGLDAWDRSTDLLPETLLHRLFGGPAVAIEVLLMLALAMLASAVPASRVLRVDPMKALRHE